MFVLGTAGHVDHGKSTFLRALTDMEPDRLPEERKRGMTIDLNFVWLTGPRNEIVGIVDVPGHKSFIKNMISGVLNIDAFLLIVAADDGWMPQTEEHVEVLRSMRVRHGLVVLTKVDLVDEARVKEVEREVTARVEAAFGRAFPVYPFSAPEKKGLAAIRAAVGELLAGLPPPEDFGAARLWIDRVFVPRGLGVVVTGTLREGSLEEGQELKLLPSGKSVVVKGLQSYKSSQTKVRPVSRCAVLLSKVQAEEVSRGDLLQAGREVPVSAVADARLEFFKPFKPRNTELPLHLGTLRETALVIPLAPAEGPQSFYARLKLKRPIPLRAGDRFLLRTPGEEASAAGGIVIDPSPRTKSHKKALASLRRYEGEGAVAAARYELAANLVVGVEALWNKSRYGRQALEAALEAAGAVPVGQGLFAEAGAWSALGASVREAIKAAHEAKKEWVSPGDLPKAAGEAGAGAALLDAVLAAEVAAGRVIRAPQGFQLAGFHRKADPVESRREQALLGKLKAAGEKPLTAKELGDEREVRPLLKRLAAEGKVVSLPEDHFLAPEIYSTLKGRVVSYLSAKGRATTSELREALGVSRKVAVLVLEKCDRDRVTFFRDNVRKLLK